MKPVGPKGKKKNINLLRPITKEQDKRGMEKMMLSAARNCAALTSGLQAARERGRGTESQKRRESGRGRPSRNLEEDKKTHLRPILKYLENAKWEGEK